MQEKTTVQNSLGSDEAVLKEMFDKGLHLGYSRTSRHPKMDKFIFGLRNEVEIFDLEKTKQCLDVAKELMRKLGKEGKMIMFLGTKKEAKELTERYAKELNMPYTKERWIGGTLTNLKQIKARIDFFNDLKKKRDTGELDKYTKKEKLNIERKIQKMEKYFGGLADTLKSVPSAMIAVDSKHERIGVEEAASSNMPVVALLNSDCDPTGINYPVPGNDSSMTSIDYFLSEIVKAYKEGQAMKAQQ